MSAPDLSVVIVTWNAAATIETCLRRLAACRLRRRMEVVVVDNASRDATVAIVRAVLPAAKILVESVNLGFAAANNLAFREARGRFVLLLNPDAFLDDPDAIEALAAFLDAHPDVAAVGPRLLFPDGRHQIGDAGHAPTISAALVHALALQRLLPRLPSLYLAPPRNAAPRAVDWICGAVLMVRREALHQAGPLDEAFFLYGEDMEWGCRMRDLGLRLVHLPGIRVVHAQGGGAPAPRPSTRWIDGILQVYRKRQRRGLGLLRAALLLGFGLRATAHGAAALLSLDRRHGRAARAMGVYAGHVLGPRKTERAS